MELTLKNITKVFKDKIAVNDFNVTLTSGVYGLLGPNGAGKTSLMRILADVSNATSGEVYLNGKSKTELGADYRDVLGYLPQDVGFYKSFTAQKFLEYVATLKGIDKEKASIKIDELLKFVNLEKDRKRKIGKFSGGMKQRLGIAQALLNDPKILILDEPTAGLDPNERIRFKNLIAEISRDKIVILSTHIVSDVEFIANEILIMRDGELVEKATPVEMLNSIRGKVHSLKIKEDLLHKVQSKFKVSNIIRDHEHIMVRVVGDESSLIDGVEVIEESPNLEDLFLYYFDSDKGL
ncbi:ABC transporter ATP-binding protein [[Clostridium] sordellii]|uniref:ABC transporter, ATP-binding protein n=1 Tax=Paraclostridium sordellii TaxID=1505 RepID=A0ABM9RP31_PARSO|nr:ABC transporter ATP-binding protein [Paeniclostridium sordellii]CEJ73798.1 ABC transporter, ATP-binding protein [[Clostridium] sordellii] [Paeniclostridium sordellii]CEN69346.1 ABC transporter ATP-binding protein [[Clostridium] sordellii] [Paeniclostridium sordellii]CEN72614.1 ABC transporter ATP-binding protein [[Clostridium] sordellii] [Paeniclostridium sordellii]CEO24262.1 ABC transporter ATP-binding protein [[Clostridium] sordellii] [Paeniclostridium sordellii]CEP75793.1 ABC transporter